MVRIYRHEAGCKTLETELQEFPLEPDLIVLRVNDDVLLATSLRNLLGPGCAPFLYLPQDRLVCTTFFFPLQLY